jgi:hypothetical protein
MSNFTKARSFIKKYFKNRRPVTGLRGVRLLHDNASSGKAASVRKYLQQEKVGKLSPDILPFLTISYSRGSKKPYLTRK